jgi:hypothetical protein
MRTGKTTAFVQRLFGFGGDAPGETKAGMSKARRKELEGALASALATAASAVSPVASQAEVTQALLAQQPVATAVYAGQLHRPTPDGSVNVGAVRTGATVLIVPRDVGELSRMQAAVAEEQFTPVVREVMQHLIDNAGQPEPLGYWPTTNARTIETILANSSSLGADGGAAQMESAMRNLKVSDVVALPSVVSSLSADNLARAQALAAVNNLPVNDRQDSMMPLGSAFNKLVLSSSFQQATPAERDAQFAAMWSVRSNYALLASAGNAQTRHATTTDVAQACAVEHAAFRLAAGTTSPAGCRTQVTFTDSAGEHAIVVVEPAVERTVVGADGSESKEWVRAGRTDLPTLERLSTALSMLQPATRRAIVQVVLNPEANPDDPAWRSTPGYSTTHVSAFTAGTDGVVTAYPNNSYATAHAISLPGMAGTLRHEAGHVLQARMQANPTLQTLWATAAAANEARPSDYAFSSDAEDFAETYQLYEAVKGTNLEAHFRVLMPARFAAVDALVASLVAPPAVS